MRGTFRLTVPERWKRLVATHGPRWLAVAQRSFLVVALIAIAWYLSRHAGELAAMLTPQTLLRCVACAVLLALLHPLIGTAFFLLQRHAGIPIRWSTSLGIYMRRIPARYLPGGIWHSVARYAEMRFDAGVDGAALRKLFVMETTLVATTGLIASGAGAWVAPAGSIAHGLAVAQLAIGILVGAVALFVRRRATWRPLCIAGAIFVAVWGLTAAAFVIVFFALDPSGCNAAGAGASYLIAAVQGYVAIFAPQGWGVAEASFGAFNTCAAPLSVVLGGFVLFRVSAMLGDIVSYATWIALVRRLSSAKVG